MMTLTSNMCRVMLPSPKKEPSLNINKEVRYCSSFCDGRMAGLVDETVTSSLFQYIQFPLGRKKKTQMFFFMLLLFLPPSVATIQ